jgi:hypothetical protein
MPPYGNKIIDITQQNKYDATIRAFGMGISAIIYKSDFANQLDNHGTLVALLYVIMVHPVKSVMSLFCNF